MSYIFDNFVVPRIKKFIAGFIGMKEEDLETSGFVIERNGGTLTDPGLLVEINDFVVT